MSNKQEILDEIKRTTDDNGGRPLGQIRFTKETGIKPYEWGKFWSRFSDAVDEAGFKPNKLQSGYPEESLIDKFISLARKLKKFPTDRELQVEKNKVPGFPEAKTFSNNLGRRQELCQKVFKYCEERNGYEDIIKLCQPILEKTKHQENKQEEDKMTAKIGEVYLYQHGTRKEYKVGKTFDLIRRGKEIRLEMPEDLKLIHTIKTDDPSGVESYWHRRFVSKRKNGEWFELDRADVKSFKGWRKIC